MTNSPDQSPKSGIPLEDLVGEASAEYWDDIVALPEETADPRRIRGFATRSGSIIIDTFRPMDYLEVPEGEVVDPSTDSTGSPQASSGQDDKKEGK